MKTIHIAEGVSCIAKWPADDHWYRAQISSIPSMQKVKVCNSNSSNYYYLHYAILIFII